MRWIFAYHNGYPAICRLTSWVIPAALKARHGWNMMEHLSVYSAGFPYANMY